MYPVRMFTWRRGLFIIGAVSLAVAVVAIFKRKTNKDTKPLMSETTDKPEALPLCIFCNNESGSEEHIWPAWIHRYKKFGPLKMQEGTGPQVIADDPEQTVNTVCHTCNNTWMSKLEQKNIPSLKAMVDGKPMEIDPGRQRLLREWALKTAMINDSTKIRNGNQMFYTDQERTAMRESRAIPPQTRIWLGQIDEDWHIGIHGTDFTITNGNKLRLGEGAVTTIYMGRFVVQVVTEHIKPEYAHPDFPGVNPKSRDWEKMLIEAWPTLSKKLLWPPPTPFTNGGPNGIAYLMERWRIGTRVTPGSI
jgi:hypothetical protein